MTGRMTPEQKSAAAAAAANNARKVKATWTPAFHQIFVDLCLEQTLNGNKPGSYFTKDGWNNIEYSFHAQTGLRYEKKQLKNHWDATKEQWKVWRKLTDTDMMRWDPNTQTFGATEEDWADYIKANPDAAQFRFKELFLADKLNVIFDGTSYSGETEPATRRRRRFSDGSATSYIRVVEPLDAYPDCRTPERQNDVTESRSMVTGQCWMTKVSYSIGECIECLDGMEEIEQGSDLYLFALDIFLKKEYREVFFRSRSLVLGLHGCKGCKQLVLLYPCSSWKYK